MIPVRLIIFILMLAAAFVSGFFLSWPKYQDFQQVQAEVERKQTELDSKTAYYSEISEVWEKLGGYGDVLPKIDSALPNSYSLPAIFHSLQKMARETGLLVENLSSKAVAGEGIKEISINIEASGSYSSLRSFLFVLENSDRFFEVKNISFSSPNEGEAFSFKLTISTYIH